MGAASPRQGLAKLCGRTFLWGGGWMLGLSEEARELRSHRNNQASVGHVTQLHLILRPLKDINGFK